MTNRAYPYIPNSNQKVQQDMLDFIGTSKVEDLYAFIPDQVRMQKPFELPKPFTSEMDLKKHVHAILNQNTTCNEMPSFLGAGCYHHYVPAVCDEINGRSEFLTAYSGDTYGDHGKCQAIFEFTSMMGELLNMDVVGFPTYDGGQAAGTAVRMSARINQRKLVLAPAYMNPQLLNQMSCYCDHMQFVKVACGPDGQMDLSDLDRLLSDQVSCVFLQNPGFLGQIEQRAETIGEKTHRVGAQFIVYADPSTLGVLAPPADYGADIVCGDIQPLGIHMSYGGGLGGYLATRQEDLYVMNYPHHLYSIFENSKGEFGFARALPERTSYYVRDKGIEYLGTCVGLWAITAAVYLSVMGPEGMRELGEHILWKLQYAKQALSGIPGVKLLFSDSKHFMEFVLNFDLTGKTVGQINRQLLKEGIQGGYDLSRDLPELGQSMLICVTETTGFSDIDLLAQKLCRIIEG